MPFGLANALATFQSFISNMLFKYLGRFLVVYLDDILIYSKTKEEHKEHLQLLFEKLKENNLYVKAKRCEFFKEEIDFLGYKLTPGGFAACPDKVNAVQVWPVPKSRKQLRGFLGLANFY